MVAPARTSHLVLVALALVAIGLTAWVIAPFWTSLFMAAVLAGALRRPMGWLTLKMKGHRTWAALLLTFMVLFAILLPLAGLGTLVVAEVLQGIQWVRGVLEGQGVSGLVHKLPEPLAQLAEQAVKSLPTLQAQVEQLGRAGGQAAAAVGGIVVATTGMLLRTALMLVGLYCLLADGNRLIAWADENVPMKPGQLSHLLEEFRRTAASVLWASLATAVIQTAAGTVGYLISRAPVPLFLAIVTFVLALVPMVGGAIVVEAVGVVQLLSGHLISGIFLIIWGLAVVGVVDNLARPYLLKGGMELHGGIVFFALAGGVAAFGAFGLLLGPMAVTFLIAVMRLYRDDLAEA